MPLDIDDVIARAKLPERTVAVSLRGDLQAEWEDLERQLIAEQENTADESLAGNPKVQDLADRMEAIGRQIADCQVVFRVQGLGAKAYSDLLAKHRAADDDEESLEGVNWKTFPTALVAACCIDPVMTYEQAEEFSAIVNVKQWDDLFMAAREVNVAQVSVPFSLAASAIRARTEPNSKRPEPGASPEAASLDASLFEPPPTSTTTTPAG